MLHKTLKVLGDNGAGKKTLLGCVIYQCGTSLADVEAMETSKVKGYGGIVPFLKHQGKEISFYGPSSVYVVPDIGEDAGNPHVVFWVVDTTATDYGKSSSERLASTLSTKGLQPQERLVIVANKMDAHSWSEDAFAKIVASFQHINSTGFKLSIVPVSSLLGSNFLESPKEAPWVGSMSPALWSCGLFNRRRIVWLDNPDKQCPRTLRSCGCPMYHGDATIVSAGPKLNPETKGAFKLAGRVDRVLNLLLSALVEGIDESGHRLSNVVLDDIFGKRAVFVPDATNYVVIYETG